MMHDDNIFMLYASVLDVSVIMEKEVRVIEVVISEHVMCVGSDGCDASTRDNLAVPLTSGICTHNSQTDGEDHECRCEGLGERCE